MNAIRKSRVLHGLAVWLIALGLLWPSVQTVARSHEQLSWLICSSNPTFTVTTAQQQQLQKLENLLGLKGDNSSKPGHACPYQGCFGAQGGAALVGAPTSLVLAYVWADAEPLPVDRSRAPALGPVFSSQASRAPPQMA